MMVQKEDIINENFVALQGVLVNLTEKIDKLTAQLSSLLDLFAKAASKFNEKSAKPAESESSAVSKENADLLNKLNRLLEENKTIAKGLTLLEQRVRSSDEKRAL